MIYGYFMGFMMYYKLKLIRRVIIQPDPFLKNIRTDRRKIKPKVRNT